MVEPDELVGHVRLALGRTGAQAGRKIVVTAGGTYEPIDPVRVLANRSSGKQGFAMAQAGFERGARVMLIAGPTGLKTPMGAERIDVETSEEMRQAVLAEVENADVLVMAAAVADFRPLKAVEHKIKRATGSMDLKLEPTPDILAEVSQILTSKQLHPVVVGFAAESKDLMVNAREKLRAKCLSLIVANDITAPDSGFAVDTNRVTILDAGGGVQELPLMSKVEVAEMVMERVVGLL